MPEAVIVAGGYSQRFEGGDKAVADLAGTPLVRRVADRLVPVIDRLVLNCRADQRDALGDALAGYDHPVVYAEDPVPDQGPMAGIRTGLRAVESDYAAVVACDMPYVDPRLIEYLYEVAAGHDAAVPQLSSGWYQTTQAVYRATPMADACDRALDCGKKKILAPLEDLDWVVVSEADVERVASCQTFENVNTEADLSAAVADFS